MAQHSFKPGDVVEHPAHGRGNVYRGDLAAHDAVRFADRWTYVSEVAGNLTLCAVVNPDDREQVKHVSGLLGLPNAWQEVATALREYARPTPKITEPTGLGAVVRDRAGVAWVRACSGHAHWTDTDRGDRKPWVDIDAVEILAPGVVL